MARVYFKCALSMLYAVLLIAIPFSILWGAAGAIWGTALGLVFLLCLSWQAQTKIARAMQAGYPDAQAVRVPLCLLAEHSRRLGLVPARLLVIPSPALNAAVFGWTRRKATIVLSEGLIATLSREELSALIALLSTQVWLGEFLAKTILARFLRVLEVFASPNAPRTSPRQSYPLRQLARQAVLYPLALPVIWLLSENGSQEKADHLSVKVSRNPTELASALRKIDVSFARTRQTSPFSLRHLFLVYPRAEDPLANLFFSPQSLLPRIRNLEAGLFLGRVNES